MLIVSCFAMKLWKLGRTVTYFVLFFRN